MKLQSSPALRSIWRAIHPPLPLEPKQAQKLQNLLSASFRKRLDEEHPHGPSSRTRLTDAHIKRILDNPLLKTQVVRAANDHESDPRSLVGQLQTSLCSPQEIFETKVTMGQATVHSATEFLTSTKARLRQQQQWNADNAGRAVELVLNWLWANGLEDSLEFIYDYGFVLKSTQYLAKSHKDAVFWRWWHRACTRHSQNASEWESAGTVYAMKNLLKGFAISRYRLTNDPDQAVKVLVEAATGNADKRTTTVIGACLGQVLAQFLYTFPYTKTLSRETYQALLDLPMIQSTSGRRTQASLSLLAPDPDPLPAWTLLKVLDTSKVISNSDRIAVLAFSRRTAAMLTSQGDQEKAEFLTDKFSALSSNGKSGSSAKADRLRQGHSSSASSTSDKGAFQDFGGYNLSSV